MAQSLIRLVPVGLGIAVPTMMQVGPDEALANLCKWPRKLRPALAENCLPDWVTADYLYALAIVSICFGVVWFLWPYLKSGSRGLKMVLGISLVLGGASLVVMGLAFMGGGVAPENEVKAGGVGSAVDVVLYPASDRLILDNKGAHQIFLWGTTTGHQPEPIDKEARIIPVGHHYYFLTDKLTAYAKTRLGGGGEELVPFEVYLADEKGMPYTAKFVLLIKMLNGEMTIHTQQIGIVAGGWKKS